MHRVAVTGVGVKSPAGTTADAAHARLLSGRSTARHLPQLVGAGLKVTFGCPVDFDPDAYFPRHRQRHLDRPTQLACAAADDAVADAGLPHGAERTGVYVGTGGGHTALSAAMGALPLPKVPVATVPMTMPNATAARISIRHGLRGPALTFATACASGAVAIGEAMMAIRYGRIDRAVAGAFDSMLTPFAVTAFSSIGALSRRGEAPELASRPFDDDRDGFVLGEAAAFLVLERLDDARARGAAIYGEVAGYATAADAGHIVKPLEDGAVAAATMRAALDDAGLRPEAIGHVNAHATATQFNDRAEALALARCFPGGTPPVTANKGVTGHLLGAGGAVEAVMALRCAAEGLVPPTANHTAGNPEIDVVHGAPRRIDRAPVLSNSFGFGGHNAGLVLDPL
ncbi:beta-ketoacyl-[acyl-carrier-protein] synthase family protein [Actinomadura parmotrematis]|uniref:Beta-ketoacyl-[acyl-carrier-protein] synthase family protein n=1 Tax=Actinomadura parmotrematis TaxID=2864039 RepID=A0ABS7FQ43_9ACTN|nr:beta-ketoacyl-[acyl-carrier-protein] synthase family protein [Actinomadura parmotrematis]MBW8481677.1 beta-ketoacyl-[acyl-carrier-protein] synthase family protein [Actinomadura parmotrematis]